MSACYNAAGNPDPTQYVNASGVCVHAGGKRRSARTTRKNRSSRRNMRSSRSSRSTRRNARSTRRSTRRQNYYAPY